MRYYCSQKYSYCSEPFPVVFVIPYLTWQSSSSLSTRTDYANFLLSQLPAQFRMGLLPGLHRSHAPMANLKSKPVVRRKSDGAESMLVKEAAVLGPCVPGVRSGLAVVLFGLSGARSSFQAWVSILPRGF